MTPIESPRGQSDIPAVRPRRRLPVWAVLTLGVVVLVLALGFGGAMVTQSYLHSLAGSVETGTALEGEAKKEPAIEGRTLRGPIDILLLGLDTREGWAEGSGRADSIIVLHVPSGHDRAYLMSIPRDALVYIPPYAPAGFGGARTRANAAYAYGSRNGQGWQGGAALTANMVHELTGLKFDGVMVVDFDAFRNVVEELGGVHMCVDRETRSDHYVVVDGKPQYAYGKRSGVFLPNSYVHHAGCRDMAGWEALDFARQRKSGPYGDYDRQRHQQQLLKAIADKATSAGVVTNPVKVNDLIRAAGGTLKIDTGHAELFDYLWTLRDLATADVIMLKTNNGMYHRAKVKGTQAISPQTLLMFQAARDGLLDEYVAAHPESVIGDTADAPAAADLPGVAPSAEPDPSDEPETPDHAAPPHD
ncbi:LCP family protein [Catellatospora sp. NPDC049609]|uniref:LCP family protein n=1 Tax=Catellatospora sp. NPDC049609 TaxID=3155505 RepID=UPI00341D1B0F